MRTALLVILMSLALHCSPQGLETVEGEYTYHALEDVSPAEAKRIALEHAKIDALAKRFGTFVSSSSNTVITNNDGKSSVNTHQISASEVKGVWIEDITEPAFEIRLENEFTVVTCKVKGKARRITSAQVDLDIHLLRNGTERFYESEDFKDNDNIYLSFKSPINGYLAVYLVDDKYAYCMLPYKEQTNGIYRVKANKDYVFFSDNPEHYQPEERNYSLKKKLTIEKSLEVDNVYVIFSKNEFTKKTDNAGKYLRDNLTLVRNVDYKSFMTWLARCQRNDSQMVVKKYPITITK